MRRPYKTWCVTFSDRNKIETIWEPSFCRSDHIRPNRTNNLNEPTNISGRAAAYQRDHEVPVDAEPVALQGLEGEDEEGEGEAGQGQYGQVHLIFWIIIWTQNIYKLKYFFFFQCKQGLHLTNWVEILMLLFRTVQFQTRYFFSKFFVKTFWNLLKLRSLKSLISNFNQWLTWMPARVLLFIAFSTSVELSFAAFQSGFQSVIIFLR